MGAVLLLCLAATLSAQTGNNVLLVVNENSAVSRRIAAYYAARRSVPAVNVCRIRTTEDEEIQRAVYERDIAAPVMHCLKTRKLAEKILYLVTTLGVPLKIEGAGGRAGDAASVDSELTLLYERLKGKTLATAGPLPNPFFSRRDVPFRRPRFPIYLVTRLAAYDFDDVKGMIDRSLSARNHGKMVLDANSPDGGPGNEWLRTAAILLPAGRVLFDESPAVVSNQAGVIGYGSWGSNDPRRKQRRLGFRWLPGAIVTEYVSSNGRTFRRPPENWTFSTWEDREHHFAGSPQSLSADYLHEGATGASGHVYEPFLQYTPRPDYLFPAYLGGRNLAESYWLSIPALSWMNIVLGDPLCQIR